MEHTDKVQTHLQKHDAEHYRKFLEHMFSGFIHCEAIFDDAGNMVDFIFLEVNRSFERMTGLRDVVGKRVTDIIPGVRETNPELFEASRRVALTGNSEKLEIYFDQLKLWFLTSLYSVEKGFFTFVFDNITEQKTKEKQLRGAMNEIQNLMRNIPEVLYVLDTQNNIIQWNRKAEIVSGYSAEELSHKLIFELISDHDRPSVIAAVNDAYTRGASEVRAHLIKKDGTAILYRWSAAPLTDELGSDVGIIGIGWDLSEQVIAEEKSRLYQLQQRACLDTIPDAVWMKNVAGEYLSVNEAFLLRVGKRRSDVIGKTDHVLWPKDYADKCLISDKAVMEGKLQRRFMEVMPDAKGNPINVETIKTPIYDDAGKLFGVTGVARDIVSRP